MYNMEEQERPDWPLAKERNRRRTNIALYAVAQLRFKSSGGGPIMGFIMRRNTVTPRSSRVSA